MKQNIGKTTVSK